MIIITKPIIYAKLHLMLFLFSLGGIFSKHAAQEPFFSLKFLLYYSVVLSILVIYALGWQQIIKTLSLTSAFANKSVVVLWGMLWGHLFFQEEIKGSMLLGTLFILVGIYFVVSDDESRVTI